MDYQADRVLRTHQQTSSTLHRSLSDLDDIPVSQVLCGMDTCLIRKRLFQGLDGFIFNCCGSSVADNLLYAGGIQNAIDIRAFKARSATCDIESAKELSPRRWGALRLTPIFEPHLGHNPTAPI